MNTTVTIAPVFIFEVHTLCHTLDFIFYLRRPNVTHEERAILTVIQPITAADSVVMPSANQKACSHSFVKMAEQNAWISKVRNDYYF